MFLAGFSNGKNVAVTSHYLNFTDRQEMAELRQSMSNSTQTNVLKMADQVQSFTLLGEACTPRQLHPCSCKAPTIGA
jgi:hypothetical protein